MVKKGLLLACILSSGLMLANCGHSSSKASEEEKNSELTTKAQSTESEVGYKIEDGKIIPVNGKPVIVDFSATWCPPCQQLKPIFHKLAEEFKGRINFVTIDVDENPALAHSYGAQNIPYLVFIDENGKVADTLVGFQSREYILETINHYFGF